MFICEPIDRKAADGVAGAHYILNQVIITGPTGGAQEVIKQLGGRDAGFAPIQTCRLRHFLPELTKVKPWSASSGSRGRSESVEFSPEARADLTMSLYSTPQERSTEEAIEQINQLGREFQVFADPNYLTGPLDANPVSPCAVKQDPFEVGGSPFEVGGSSAGGLGADADPTIFWKQWAFDQIGLGPDGSGRGGWTGEGVTVAVFDTSPYSPGDRAMIRDANVDLNLALVFPPLANALEPVAVPTAAGSTTLPVKVADHGLFAAGLVHAVAPQSQIHLVRVLNDYGCGDLWTLNRAVNDFVAQWTDPKTQRLDNVVLNFSLGVHQPRDLDKLGWPAEIVSLDETLLNAYGRGAVLVAASGNDSYASPAPRPMQLPADWNYVIGVAASSQNPGHACYSNLGDVAASGADGRLSASAACEPRAHQCDPVDAGCPLGLVSLATQSKTGYRFWVGTSFAAPLVSGQAALLLSSALASPDVQRCIMATAIDHGALSVANVASSVRRCTSAPSP
jgi:hypothetical protein